jgi:hypothetical protein
MTVTLAEVAAALTEEVLFNTIMLFHALVQIVMPGLMALTAAMEIVLN